LPTDRLGAEHFTQRRRHRPSELRFLSIVLRLTDTLKQTACAMAPGEAEQMEVDWAHCAQ